VPDPGRLTVVLIAEEAAGVQVLEALRVAPEAPKVEIVVTTTEPGGARRPVVAEAAGRLGLAVRPTNVLSDVSFAEWIRDRHVDLLLNVHSLTVLDAAVVSAPAIGSFNLHPGPLPQYAGLNVPSWAIYLGETHHGVTLHWMNADIDAGPIAYESSFELDEIDTGLSLTAKCVRQGVPLVSQLIADAARDPALIPVLDQDAGGRRYFGREVPNDGNVIWSAPAREVVRFVRAADYAPFASPWGIPRARLEGRPVGIAKASLTGEPAEEAPGSVGPRGPRRSVMVAAADEWILVERMWRDGRGFKPSELCATGDRLADGS
jgi:methionyl-tRNA formyltransferase